MADIKTSREQETREKTSRKRSWEDNVLPDPEPHPGFKHRYIRVSTLAEPDISNVNLRMREGWTPVTATEQTSIATQKDATSRYPENIVIGGLMLCQMPEEDATARREYFAQKAINQANSIRAEMADSGDRMVRMTGGFSSEVKNHK